MSDLLDRLDRTIQIMAPHQKERYQGKLLIEACDELRRLEKENALFKSSLIEIRNLSQRTGYSFEDQSFAATRLATEALMA